MQAVNKRISAAYRVQGWQKGFDTAVSNSSEYNHYARWTEITSFQIQRKHPYIVKQWSLHSLSSPQKVFKTVSNLCRLIRGGSVATASLIEFLWFSFTCVSRVIHKILFSAKSLAIARRHISTNSSYYLQHFCTKQANLYDTNLHTNTKTQKRLYN